MLTHSLLFGQKAYSIQIGLRSPDFPNSVFPVYGSAVIPDKY